MLTPSHLCRAGAKARGPIRDDASRQSPQVTNGQRLSEVWISDLVTITGRKILPIQVPTCVSLVDSRRKRANFYGRCD